MGCKALGICLLQCAIMHSAHAMTKGEGWVNGNNALMKRRQLQQWRPGSSPELQPLSSVKPSLILLLPSRAEWFHLFTFAAPPAPTPCPKQGPRPWKPLFPILLTNTYCVALLKVPNLS